MFYDEPVIIDGPEYDFHTTNLRLALPNPPIDDVCPEDIPSKKSKEKNFHLRLPKIKGIFKAFSVLLIIAAFFIIVSSIRNVNKMHKFEQELEARNYSEAYILYQGYQDNSRLRGKANSKLAAEPQSLVDMYSQGSIGYEDMLAAFDKLSSFTILSDELSVARDVVKQLQASRSAYEEGLQIESASERLLVWGQVLEADKFGFSAVKDDVSDNQEKYKTAIFAEIEDCIDCGLYKRAYNLSELLYKWYPKDTEVSSMKKSTSKYADAKDNTNSIYPIKIEKVSVSTPNKDSYVDLFISWQNVSAKTITEIKFYVVPYNSIGNAVADNDHMYSEFCAIDKRTFAPGEAVPSNTWGWEKAWKNSDIVNVSVTKVEVTFADGAKKIFENFHDFTSGI